MKKKRWDIWCSQLSRWIKALRFSSLDGNTQTRLKREMLFFNNSRFVVIAVVSMVLETMNIVNVLFFSRSGLGSANNRLYFTMYLILFGAGALCLVLRHFLKKSPVLVQRCFISFTLVWVLWHAALTAIDLRHNSNIIVFATGILSMSLLVRMKPLQMLSILAAGFALLLCCADGTLSNGNTINALIITVVAMLVFCSRYFSMVDELGYRQKLVLQSSHTAADRARLLLLSQQQTALLAHSDPSIFVWDKSSGTLAFGGGRQLCKEAESALSAWLAGAEKNSSVFLHIGKGAALQEYEVKVIPQMDSDLAVIGAVGQINLKD